MNTREVVHVLNMACFSRALFIRPSAGCRRGLPPSTPPPPPPPSFSWGSVFLSLSLSLPFSMNGKGHICHSPLPFTGRKEEGKGRRGGGEGGGGGVRRVLQGFANFYSARPSVWPAENPEASSASSRIQKNPEASLSAQKESAE